MSMLKALPAAALLFLPTAATVHSVSVVPSSGKTEVVIGVNAAVEVQDFTLDAPARVVVDMKGATLDMRYRTYDKVSRGGITNVRYSQYRPNIVRVVIEMDAKHPYEVKRSNGEVRVSVTGGKLPITARGPRRRRALHMQLLPRRHRSARSRRQM